MFPFSSPFIYPLKKKKKKKKLSYYKRGSMGGSVLYCSIWSYLRVLGVYLDVLGDQGLAHGITA